MADLQSFHTAQNNIIMHLNNTTTGLTVAGQFVRHAILQSVGWVVEITLLDREGIANDLRFVSHHDDMMTLYSPIRHEAEPLPRHTATHVSDFVRECYEKLFPGTDRVSIRLVRAGRAK